jgi:serralysin
MDQEKLKASQTATQLQQVNTHRWCFCYYAGSENAGINEKALLLKGARWQPGQSIKISFLDGDIALQKKVIAAAEKWTEKGMANLKFSFDLDSVDHNTDIRISFRRPGSWSVLGTTCQKITDREKPTMNFGWLNDNSTDDEINRVVLHEFGHAIGLLHEHMNPEGGIKWNRDQVIKDLKAPPNSWDDATIENNMFRAFAREELELTNMDPKSIMMYTFPPEWTEDGFSAPLNTELSETDIQFIRKIYPGNDSI